ncbi:cytochrome c biogenesis CcdA family protein [Paenactinomyces guangxiensis]|uniref:Sulfite exporter TauE/SafE family protein n=1 Tax=Paenactinomyces guangxiensis TaxID=1490290 RepID=A0A7W1WQL5_9BACL|nr:cytochrome c biogenesis protein CcdA [Paenactinomyces guangxiensis]MBA4494277.1 sulfite exporter TauE/SafE family protein [Paenactinomyces guangxiensis]MBH8590771.1 sulfite exporter TauE/SafE family protein [Paenactinomyces guangxiensis]
MENVTWWLAFGAGVLSFISPCCLPLYPSYLSYITGVSVAQLKESERSREVQKLTLLHTLFFILGFSLVFYALGFTFSKLGQLFIEYRDMIRMLGGILIAVMGLFLMGIFQPRFLMREKKWQVTKKGFSYFGSTLIGIGFAAGWTPCIGPILLAVLSLVTVNPELGFAYITAYTLGFAIPFFIMAFFVGRTRWILKYSSRVMKVGGGLMVFFGILLYTNQMTAIISWFTQLTGGFTGF